jgi:flagellar FliL protein
MAAEKTDENTEVEQPKSSSLKKLIIIGVIVLLAGGGGAFAWFKFFKKEPVETVAKPEVAETVVQDVETFLVNLSDPGGRRYLKLTMKAKLNNKRVAEEFAQHAIEIKDSVLTLLSSKEFAEISTAEDKATLKQEILQRMNRLLGQGQVQEIYFTEFLVQ